MFDLAAMFRRLRRPRRTQFVLRDINPPATLAGNLYLAAYKPVIELWAAAIDEIVAEYERSLSGVISDSAMDLQARLDRAQSDFERLFILLTAGLNDWAVRTERWQRSKWRAAVMTATGVDIDTLIGPESVRRTLEGVIQWNTSLIRNVSDEARQRIASAVFAGLHERKPARDVAAEIREAVAMSRRRSLGIAADQLAKLTSALAAERRREAGISSWIWRSSHKLHFRPQHQARDGHIYTDETAPADLPGQLPFCGCREQAVIDLS